MDLGKAAKPLISRICRAGHAQRMAMNTVRTKSSSGLTRDRPERSESSVVGHVTSSLGQVPRNGLIKTSLKWATAHRSRLFRNRITHHRLIGDRYPQHQTVLRSEVAVPVAFGRGEVFNELFVSGI